jgi:hypothetical protein
MAERKAHQVWLEQCEAVKTIKARFGLKAAFDYIVGEKLLNFAEASESRLSARTTAFRFRGAAHVRNR